MITEYKMGDNLLTLKNELDCLQADYESLVILALSDLAKRTPETGYRISPDEQDLIWGHTDDFRKIRAYTWTHFDPDIRRDISKAKVQSDSARQRYREVAKH